VELTHEVAAPGELETESVERIDLQRAVLALDLRDRELIALRYGADLTARQIGELLGERTNTVEVALHRALDRLGAALAGPGAEASPRPARGRSRPKQTPS
jgi:RNA polymerase sigma factor (sigma-70 family)